MTSPLTKSDCASSPVIGVIMMLGIVFILFILVLLLCLDVHLPESDGNVPEIFVISQIRHTSDEGVLNYNSLMTVLNHGKSPYDNRKLFAKTYRNGVRLTCDIPTLNGHDFIYVHPCGIQWMGDLGSHNYYWYPNTPIKINYAQGTFHPGDTVMFEVYDRATGKIVSRSTYPEQKKYTTQWFYNHFLNPQSA